MPKDLPGLFFDEEKGKYFPLSMKAAYENEKRIKDAARKEFEIQKSLRETTEVDLYKYLRNQPRKFDCVKEKISRMKINYLKSSNKIFIDIEHDKYYEASRLNRSKYLIRINSLSSDNFILDEFIVECDGIMLGFNVHFIDERESLYYFFMERGSDRAIEYGCKINGSFIKVIDCFDFTFEAFICYYCSGYILYSTSTHELQVTKISESHAYLPNQRNLPNSSFVKWYPKTDIIWSKLDHIYITGLQIDIKLESSSAQWLTYYRDNLFVLTYHGQFLRINLADPDAHVVLFETVDLEIYANNTEKLIIEMVDDRIVAFAYFKGKRTILFFDLESCKFIEKVSVDHEIQQFKVSKDLKSLYIHHHPQ